MAISTIENRIRKVILERCGGSNQAFADAIDINVSTIQKWKGENFPKGDFLLRIKEKFNVNINWLLTGQGETYIYKDRKPVPVPPHLVEDKDGQWGEGREATVDGKKVPLTLFSPDGQEVPPGEEYDFGKASNGLREIYDSQDAVLIPAIEANIRAFQLSVRRDRQIQQQAAEINALKDECEELKDRVAALEERHKDDPPDHEHKSPHKEAI